MMDNRTKRSRGFGYVKFNSHEAVACVLNHGRHILNGKEVDAKHCNVNMKGRVSKIVILLTPIFGV